MWVRRETKMSVIGWILCQQTVARTEVLIKEHYMLRAPSSLAYVAFIFFYFKSVAKTWICGNCLIASIKSCSQRYTPPSFRKPPLTFRALGNSSLRNTGWVRMSHHSSALYWLSSPKHFFFFFLSEHIKWEGSTVSFAIFRHKLHCWAKLQNKLKHLHTNIMKHYF